MAEPSNGLGGNRPARLAPAGGAAGGPAERLQTRVYFHFACSEGPCCTQFGESVRAVGSHPALGSWDPSRGVNLTTNADIYPCWISQDPIFIELREEVEYKYVIVDAEGGVRAWEEYEGNRRFIASGPDLTVEDDDGLHRAKTAGADDPEEEEEDDDKVGFLMRTKTPVRKMDKEQKLAFIRDLEGDVEIGDNDTTFMMMLELPVKVVKAGNNWTVTKLNTGNSASSAYLPVLEELKRAKKRVVCVGWPGVHVKSEKDQIRIETLLKDHDCIPVFPPEILFEQYLKFCTVFLWPVFHDVMLFFQTSNPRSFDEDGWAAYQHMNLMYANTVVPHLHIDDMVWIHDYHLMVVPTFIARRHACANIGFYLHTPFPSSDSFKSLPVREELMSGMLNADQLGFQFFAYARNFIVSAKRIYGLDPTFRAGGFIGMDYNGREIMLKVAHFVYGFKEALKLCQGPRVHKEAQKITALFQGKSIFASMDRCDGLSGLTPKFRAFKRFIKEHPQYKGKVVLVQYLYEPLGCEESGPLKEFLSSQADAVLKRGEDGELMVELLGAQDRAVSFGDSCDIYIRTDRTEREDCLALYRAAHVHLDTTVKGGLNLMPFEFITAHYDDARRHDWSAGHSVNIVSEFSGCSRVLLGSLRINPWNTMELVAACKSALTMAEAEKRERYQANYTYAEQYSMTKWFEDFLADLRRARKKDGAHMQTIGFGAKMRAVAMGNCEKLAIEYVLQAYQKSKRRVIFLDNEGTLAADKAYLFREYGAPKGDVTELKAHGTAPNQQVLENLATLAEDSRNSVVILSGRDRDKLVEWFGSEPRIGLAAEHGFYYKLPIVTGEQWHCMDLNQDYTWKLYAFELMRQFVKRTQGSFIENKGSALVWQYRDADQHFGSWQAKELSSHLKDLLFGFDVDVIDGRGYVEVKLQNVNKGTAVEKLLGKISKICGDADFVLCIGDDRSDEDMFEAVNRFIDPSEVEPNFTDQSATDGGSVSDDGSDVLGRDAGKRPRSSRGEDSGAADGGDRSTGLGMGRKKSDTAGGLAGGMGAGLGSKARSKASASGMGFGGSIVDLTNMGAPTASDDEASQRRFFTCTVGQKPSAAKFFLHDVDEVSELINSLASAHRRKMRVPDFSGNRGSIGFLNHNARTWAGGDVGMRGVSTMPGISTLPWGMQTLPAPSAASRFK